MMYSGIFIGYEPDQHGFDSAVGLLIIELRE